MGVLPEVLKQKQELTPAQDVLRKAEASIINDRARPIEMTGLTPHQEYEVALLSHDFPFGTAIRGEAIAVASGDPQATKGLSEKQHVDKEYAGQYVDTFARTFNGIVEKNWFKWDMMQNLPKAAAAVTGSVWKFLKENPDMLAKSRGHNVFWNRTRYLPHDLQGKTKDEIATAVIDERLKVIQDFPFPEWDLVNEPLKSNEKSDVVFDPKADIDFFVKLFKEAKAKNPDVNLYVNEYDVLNGKKTDQYIEFIKSLVEKGAPVDGIGVQMHIRPGDVVPLEIVKENLDKLAALNLPIKITELSSSDEAHGTEADRAKYMKELMTVFYGTPAVAGVYLWGFDTKLQGRRKTGEQTGLFDQNLQPNQVGQTYLDLITKDWSTNTTVTADEHGKATFHGYSGIYHAAEKQQMRLAA